MFGEIAEVREEHADVDLVADRPGDLQALLVRRLGEAVLSGDAGELAADVEHLRDEGGAADAASQLQCLVVDLHRPCVLLVLAQVRRGRHGERVGQEPGLAELAEELRRTLPVAAGLGLAPRELEEPGRQPDPGGDRGIELVLAREHLADPAPALGMVSLEDASRRPGPR